jgi:hypothetical protein
MPPPPKPVTSATRCRVITIKPKSVQRQEFNPVGPQPFASTMEFVTDKGKPNHTKIDAKQKATKKRN